MAKLLELKTNRSLIKPNFEGYKLSLDNIPVIVVDLELNQLPCFEKPTSDQYSLLYAELFSLQNLLVQDPWNRELSYFVTRYGRSILCSNYNENTGRPSSLKSVFEFPQSNKPIKSDRYNFSFKFISEKYCVFCDGYDCLILLDTSDRYKILEWKSVFKTEVAENIVGFCLKDCRFDIIDGNKIISCIFQHIEDNINQLFYGQISQVNENAESKWKWEVKDVLVGKGLIRYCAFEPRSISLILCANKPFKFSSHKNKEANKLEKSDSKSNFNIIKHEFTYVWTQNEVDVVINFEPMEHVDKKDFEIICTDEIINVKCKGNFLLKNGKFDQKIDSELTTWNFENKSLQIILIKKNQGTWKYFVEGGPSMDDNYVENIPELNYKHIANLDTPLEDCDMISNLEEEYYIDRINLPTKILTHKVSLGCHPPLFSTILRPGFPAAIATRTDVDASLWLQQFNPTKPDDWSLRHEGNLHAFGYIEASKQQKKFSDCSPDLNYFVIAESFRHVFIYNIKNDNANNLRNRNGRQITLGKQNLVTIDQNKEIIGMTCGLNFITLLSEKSLLYIQINK